MGHIPVSKVVRARERDECTFRLELESLVVKLLSLSHRHGRWHNEEFPNLVDRPFLSLLSVFPACFHYHTCKLESEALERN